MIPFMVSSVYVIMSWVVFIYYVSGLNYCSVLIIPIIFPIVNMMFVRTLCNVMIVNEWLFSFRYSLTLGVSVSPQYHTWCFCFATYHVHYYITLPSLHDNYMSPTSTCYEVICQCLSLLLCWLSYTGQCTCN